MSGIPAQWRPSLLIYKLFTELLRRMPNAKVPPELVYDCNVMW